MRDYIRIISKIQESVWLITPEALNVILAIVDERLTSGRLSDDEIALRLQQASHSQSETDGTLTSDTMGNGIGIISLEGPLFGKANLMTEMSGATSLETFSKDFAAMVNDDNIRSIVINIDSPGGTAELVREVGDQIFEARDSKPIYAFANSMAGSAAYWLASQASEIHTNKSGMVGSVGAYTVHEDKSVADAQQGRRFTFINAGKFKTEGNEHQPLTAEAKEYRQELIDDLYGDFVQAIANGRQTDAEAVTANYGQGRMVPANKALDAGMIDGITTFDGLINQIASQPRQVQVVMPAPAHAHSMSGSSSAVHSQSINPHPNFTTISGSLIGNVVHVSGTNDLIPTQLESKEMEHSEPGTGTPPAPRKDEDGSDDMAIRNRWRRDPLPVFGPNAPSPHPPAPNSNASAFTTTNNGGEVYDLTPEEIAQLEAIRNVLGCSDDTFLTDLRVAVEGYMDLQTSMQNASEDERLKHEFPQMWKQHQELLEKDRLNQATEFAASVKTFAVMSGDQLRPSNNGLSALAVETVVQTHLKFANGTVTQEDFERCINTITQGGVVEYGERGSSRVQNTENLGYINTSSAEGIRTMRQQFFALVQEIQTQDGLPMADAITEAAKRHPELAQAYQNSNPLNSPTGA